MNKHHDFEHVNAHIEQVDLEQFESGGQHHMAARAMKTDPMSALRSVCAIYQIVRPIIGFVSAILPSKWRKALTTFTTLMDQLCPE